jgi:hypothetical protein
MNAELVEDNLPVPRDSLEQLLRHRARALDLFRQAMILLQEAESAALAAAPMEPYAGMVYKTIDRALYGISTNDTDGKWLSDLMARAAQNLDYWAWTSLQRLSGLRSLMDDKAAKEFKKQLEEKAPPFTADNIKATYMGLAADSVNIFERGLINVFKKTTSSWHVTNSSFRINPRCILTRMCRGKGPYSGLNYNGAREELQDLERVFFVLDGKKPPEGGNAADIFEAALKRSETTADSEYFSCRMFPVNGNMHLKFKRLDLVERANAIIVKHLGGLVPDDRRHHGKRR